MSNPTSRPEPVKTQRKSICLRGSLYARGHAEAIQQRRSFSNYVECLIVRDATEGALEAGRAA